jgi:hypothetical protein
MSTRTGLTFLLNVFPNLELDKTYNVSVRTNVNDVWSDYGQVCQITTPNYSHLTNQFCGKRIENRTVQLKVAKVLQAGKYRMKIEGPNGYEAVSQVRDDEFFRLSHFPSSSINIKNNVEYQISVSWSTDGDVWSDYGIPCSIMLMGTTKLNDNVSDNKFSCGQTFADDSNVMWVNPVQGATRYEFEVRRSGGLITRDFANWNNVKNETTNYLRFSRAQKMNNGNTYFVKVRYEINGFWSEYGEECTVTIGTPSGITTQNNSTSDFSQEVFLSVYPNPNNGSFTASSSQAGQFVLLNSLGQIIQEFNLSEENLKFEFIQWNVFLVWKN